MENKDRWSALSMTERADLIKLYTSQGITDLMSMRKHYNGIPYANFATSDYDYYNAAPDMTPKKEGEHWDSRNPSTGQILKREDHPTFDLAVEGEDKAGYIIRRGIDGKLYSLPEQPNNNVEVYNSFGPGGYFHNILNKVKNFLTKETVDDTASTTQSQHSVVLPEPVITTRVRENDVKTTKEKSENIENDIAQRQFKLNAYAKSKGHNATPYFIPYEIEKEIVVPGVGRVSTNMLDSLIVNGRKAGITDAEALGLGALETKFGAIPNWSLNGAIKGKEKALGRKMTEEEKVAFVAETERAALNASFARNYGGIYPQFLVNDHEWHQRGWEESSKYKHLKNIESPLEHAFNMFKLGIYNTGNKTHTKQVQKEGNRILELPIVQKWYEKYK